MKQIGIWCGMIVGCLFGIPSLIIFLGGFYDPLLLQNVQASASHTIQVEVDDAKRAQEIIEILAKTVPPTQSPEAIKVQAIMVRTYLERREQGIVQDGELGRISIQEMKQLWQEDFEEVYESYALAVSATKGEMLYHKGELIEPVYHKESAGYTRDAMSLYNMDVPYLKGVESPWDTGVEEKVILKSEFIATMKATYPSVILDEAMLQHQIQIVGRDHAGYVQSLQIGNILLTGEEFKALFGLPSTCFDLASSQSELLFKTKGTGHGVGLSQNGANQMALEGKNYTEILDYYFTDIEIKK